MKKRILSLMLTAAMLLGLTACAGTAAPAASSGSEGTEAAATEAEAAAPAADGEYDKLVMVFPATGRVPDEQYIHDVEEKINEITRPAIGAEIELQLVAYSSYQQQVTLMLSGDEQVDIAFLFIMQVNSAVGAEQLRDTTDLLNEYGQGIKDVIGDLMVCGNIDGHQYLLPVNTEVAQGGGFFELNKEIVDKYNIDVDAIKTFDDLTEVFQLVHEKEPQMEILCPGSSSSSSLATHITYDKLGDYYGVLLNYGQDPELKVENLFESQEYYDYCNQYHQWYEMGFISDDVVSTTDSNHVKMKAGNLFAYTHLNKPGVSQQDSAADGREVVGVQLLPTLKVTNYNGNLTIPENAKHPEKAMQFLNMLYTNSDIINLMAYGIEGRDYVVREDGRIGYPEGIDANNVPYSMMSMTWGMGNQFNAYVWETNDPDIWEQTAEYAKNEDGITSLAFGFIFDSTPVATEEAAVANAYNQYKVALECGLLDPETTIPEMNEKLYAAGLQAIMDEKQAQLDKWAELQGLK